VFDDDADDDDNDNSDSASDIFRLYVNGRRKKLIAN